MNRLLRVLSSVCALLWVCCGMAEARPPIKLMAVAGFEHQSAENIALAIKDFDQSLHRALADSGRFKLLEAGALPSALKSADVTVSAWDVDHARKSAGLVEADYVVYGAVAIAKTSAGHSLTVSVSIYDKLQDESILVDTLEIEDSGGVGPLLRGSVESVSREIVLSIYPLTIAANKKGAIVLNYGRHYVSNGDMLDVITEGDEVVDPGTGISLGLAEDVLGQIQVTKVKTRYANARIIRADGELLVGSECRASGAATALPAAAARPVYAAARPASAQPAYAPSALKVLDYARVEGAVSAPGKLRVAIGDFIYGEELSLDASSDRSRKVSTRGMTGHGGLVGELNKVLFGNPNAGSSGRKPSADQSKESDGAFTRKSAVLREMIATRLTKTRQCEVLERSRMDELMREVELIESGAKGLFEKDKLSGIRLKGADYLVYGTITKLSERVHNSTKIIHSRNTVEFEMTIDMRIVDVSTGRIITSEEVTASSESSKHNANIFGIMGSGSESGGGVAELLASCADQVAIKVTTSLRPIVILDVNTDSGEIIVNYGDGVIQEGEVFNVFQQGRILLDPYSGQILGKAESLVGRVAATHISERTCVMTPEGKKVDPTVFQTGMICRPYRGE